MAQDQHSGDQHTGGCLCGAVRYHFGTVLHGVVNCHCSQCRRTHGSYGPYTGTKLDDLVFDEQRGLKWYRSSPDVRRGFCKECGASLFFSRDNKSHIAISAGTLDTPTGMTTTAHIFTEDKADFYEITDDLPQHERGM